MIPRIIHQIHLGPPMPVEIKTCVLSIGMTNPLISRVIWDEVLLASIRIDADRLYNRLGNWASVSNYVRLLLLKRFGGIYLDTDFVAIKPMDSLFEHEACAAFQDGERICNAFMGATPNHPWINWQITNFLKFDQKDPASGVYLATGAPREGLTMIPQRVVYPWLYGAPESERWLWPETLVEHKWRGSWKPKSCA